MAVSAVFRLGYFSAPCPLEPRNTPKNTGETHCAPLLKSKSSSFLIAGGRFEPGKAAAHREGGVDALLDRHPLQSTQLA